MKSRTVRADLTADVDTICADWIERYNLKHGTRRRRNGAEDWKDPLLAALTLARKLPEAKPRRVEKACDFTCPDSLKIEFRQLCDRIEAGSDLRPVLSQQAQESGSVDRLLYDWGIHHLHLDNTSVGRTDDFVFCMIDNDAVYMIQMARHRKPGEDSPWASRNLLTIVADNWPHLIEKYKLPEGMTPVDRQGKPIDPATEEDIETVRKAGITVPVYVPRHGWYLPTGGGFTGTGDSASVCFQANKIHNQLVQWEEWLKGNVDDIVRYIERARQTHLPPTVRFMVTWTKGELVLIENQTKTELGKMPFVLPTW